MSDAALEDDLDTPLPERRANRPITLTGRMEYAAARGLFAFFHLIGIDAASALAGGFTRFVGPLLGSVSKRADDNLRAVYPEWTSAERRRIIAKVWENLGRTTAEFAFLDKFDTREANGRVEIVGAEKIKSLAESGRPAIFVSGHFANWELMAITLHQAGVKTAVVYRAANNPLIDELIINMRAEVMSRVLIPKGKRGGRALIDALKQGRSIAMLVDQKLNDGISVPFLGRDAMTAPAAARLALKFNTPVIQTSIERLKGAHFRMTVHEPIAFTPTGDVTEDVRQLTILINEALERDIRARPEQWLWLHRRWTAPGSGKKKKKKSQA
ncbi:MAG: lysophospholipid acyltransferase family protein [Parvularculaceae bacterium]